MASEEGLKILLKGEVQDFLKDFKSVKDAIVSTASTAAQAGKSFFGLSAAAEGASNSAEDLSKSLKEESSAANQSSAATASATKFIRQMAYERKLALIQLRNGTDAWKIESKAVENVANTAMPALQRSIKGSSSTLVSFGRIVQDAPYGIIGIGNNITQFAEQFQYLRQRTGSAGAALKALGSSILGAGGLTLGISLLITGITALTQKYGSLSAAAEALIGGLTKQQKAQKAITDSLKGSESEYTKAVANVSTLRNEIELAKGGFIDKTKVVKHYNDTIGKTTGQVKTLEEAEKSLQQNAEAYIKFTLLKAAANQALEAGAKKAFEAELERRKSDKQSSSFILSGLPNSKDPSVLKLYQKDAAKNREKAAAEFDKDKNLLEDIANQFEKQAAAISKTFNFDFFGGKEDPKKEKDIKTVADVLKELQAALNATDAQAKLFGGTADNLAQEKIKALNKAFDDLVKLGLKPTSPELKKIADQINFLSASILGVKPLDTKFLQPLGKAVKTIKVKPLTADELKKVLGLDFKSELQIDPKVQIEPIFQTTPGLENLNKFATQFTTRMGQISKSASKEFNKNFIVLGDALDFTSISPAIVDLGNQLRSAFAGISEGIGDALGNILTGKATLASALGSLVGIMGDFIVQFGKSLVQAATLRIIAEKALIANPYLALAAGIGAIAIGTALKNSVPRFATGGVVNGPTLAMVGDNPSGVEYMIPKEILDRLGGGDNMEVFGRFQLAGTDLVASITRTRREEARTR